MPALDFSEIAAAGSGPDRDQFEFFARDFLAAQGFEVIIGPDRGPDAGRDLVVLERREGPGGTSIYNWLVSCKHKTNGAAVSHTEEMNIRDRMETHGCQGFIAFYSTLPSSTLSQHLEALKRNFGQLTYDREAIEAWLLATPKARSLAARYFPVSFQRWVVTS